MIWDAISEKLMQQGYVQSSRDTRIAEFLIQVTEDKKMNICSIIKNVNGTHVVASQIVESAKQLERKFLLSGYRDVTVMHIIFTDRNEDVSKLEKENIQFWLVDMNALRLMIFENQPDDYCGLKNVIENAVRNYNYEDVVKKKKSYITKNMPFITIVLIAINVLIFLVCEKFGSTENTGFMIDMGALDYRLISENHEFYRIISCMFLHFGFAHLVNNMFTLGVVGVEIEKWLGHLRYLLIYFISGIGASVASLAYHNFFGEDVVSAGASGAIYGIFGALIVMIFKNRMSDTDKGRVIFVIALLVLGSFQENVDFAAHIGGLVVGMITTFAMSVSGHNIGE